MKAVMRIIFKVKMIFIINLLGAMSAATTEKGSYKGVIVYRGCAEIGPRLWRMGLLVFEVRL